MGEVFFLMLPESFLLGELRLFLFALLSEDLFVIGEFLFENKSVGLWLVALANRFKSSPLRELDLYIFIHFSIVRFLDQITYSCGK
mmetsp:Transcript_41158/g.66189  ORF Transcript_41158/g.66189 Transcript_41158/m.66189 type:complete len:86 (-) Transcript_41158:1376-1633(-)